MATLLVIDDEPAICWALQRLGQQHGHSVASAASAEEGLRIATQLRPEVIFLDVRLPGQSGLQAMPELRRLVGQAPIVVMTAYGDLATAVAAVREGAFDYLLKPFDLAIIERTLQRALAAVAAKSSEAQANAQASDTAPPGTTGEIVGTSPPMQEVFKRIALVAASEAGVHISGESGTGKELVARAIHQYSPRGAGPFVAVPVASLSESLAEAELFGHVRGAFTGASEARTGLLEQADGGTLLLDEVAEIPPPLQVKLLRALEYREVIPVGSNEPRKINVRIVSATHRDLAAEVRLRRFREDLFYRLNTFEIHLPPLRQRREDLLPLARHFLSRFQSGVQLADETIEVLALRQWPGNVRELRNALEHAAILARGGLILPEHLPAPATASQDSAATALCSEAGDAAAAIASAVRRWADEQWSSGSPDNTHQRLLALVEPPLFEVAMSHNQGQYASAARQLGLHRVTLRRRLGSSDSMAEPS